MSQLGSASDDLRNDHPEIRRRRLLFRCWYRGTQESDLLLGSFADTSLDGLTAPNWGGRPGTSSLAAPTEDRHVGLLHSTTSMPKQVSSSAATFLVEPEVWRAMSSK